MALISGYPSSRPPLVLRAGKVLISGGAWSVVEAEACLIRDLNKLHILQLPDMSLKSLSMCGVPYIS